MSDASHETTDSALADALWWFRGFAATRQTGEHDQTFGLAEKLKRARSWLNSLASGEKRLVGLHERELGIVLTEGEFEMVYDALRFGDRTPKEEVEQIVGKLRYAYERFSTERSAMKYDPDIPF
jgi:hypothetical protein